jgi:hypothetical protein
LPFHIHVGGKGKRWNSYKDTRYFVVRLQLWGSTMAPWHWCNIMNFKNPCCWSSHIRSNNGPSNLLKISKAFRNPKLVLMMAKCFRNVISTSKASQYWKYLIVMALKFSCVGSTFQIQLSNLQQPWTFQGFGQFTKLHMPLRGYEKNAYTHQQGGPSILRTKGNKFRSWTIRFVLCAM